MEVNWKEIVGKTIKSVDTTSVNCVFVKFTDGTHLAIDTESAGLLRGLHRPVLYPAKDYEPKRETHG